MASIRILFNKNTTQTIRQLFGRNYFNCCQQNLRSINSSLITKTKPNFTKINNKLITNGLININYGQKCLFHLSPKRYNPIVTIVLRQMAKVVAIFTGRILRKWWRELPSNKRQLVMKWFIRHKWKFSIALISLIVLFNIYYYSHIEKTPITNRKRFIAFNPKQMKDINNYEFETKLELFKDKLLPNSHPISKRVAKVATQLLNGNNDLPQIHDQEWSVSVIDEDIKNAFVLPSGQIFVFTGMLSLCENDQQLGVILGHEMAHSVLAHSAELLSHSHLIDLAFICILSIVWTLMPTDLTATIISVISRFVTTLIVDTPYSRMLETEADIVGLELAAKACFDVRESSAFWHKMSIISNVENTPLSMDKITVQTEFLSTHPSHEKRYNYLDSLMDEAIKIRNDCKCPPLPKFDPRINVELMKKTIEEQHMNKRREGVLILTKPSRPFSLPTTS